MSDDTLLEVRGVTKVFGGVVANDSISIDVPRGGIVGLIGPNGSGKTTLFNSIVGAHVIDSGSVRFAGQQLALLVTAFGCLGGEGFGQFLRSHSRFFRLLGVRGRKAEAADEMAFAVLLLQHDLELHVPGQRHGLSEREHCHMRLADLRIDAPGRLRIVIDRLGNAPAGLIEVRGGGGELDRMLQLIA